MATHSSILTWRTPWTEEPGGLHVHRVSNSWTQVKWLSTHEHHILTRLTDCSGEGNGTPLQHSCLENPRDGGAWWAAVCGAAQSRTRLKRLSSSSSSTDSSPPPMIRFIIISILQMRKVQSRRLRDLPWATWLTQGYMTYPGLRDLPKATRFGHQCLEFQLQAHALDPCLSDRSSRLQSKENGECLGRDPYNLGVLKERIYCLPSGFLLFLWRMSFK